MATFLCFILCFRCCGFGLVRFLRETFLADKITYLLLPADPHYYCWKWVGCLYFFLSSETMAFPFPFLFAVLFLFVWRGFLWWKLSVNDVGLCERCLWVVFVVDIAFAWVKEQLKHSRHKSFLLSSSSIQTLFFSSASLSDQLTIISCWGLLYC